MGLGEAATRFEERGLPFSAPSDRPVDNLGDPVPDCAAASAEIMESTMFPSAEAGDLSKRTLAPDDELAAREIYPAGAGAPPKCDPPVPKVADPPGGCAVGGGGRGATPHVFVVLSVLFWVLTRIPPRLRGCPRRNWPK